jgi:magnesium-transporting ATPase (P-type)
MVFVGTIVTNDTCVCVCVCVVTKINMATEIRKIQVVANEDNDTPLIQKLDEFANLFIEGGGYNLCFHVTCKI